MKIIRKAIQKFLGLFGYELRMLSRRHATPLSSEWFGNFYYFVRMYEKIRSVPGDIVECGVGRGRTFLYLAFLTSADSVPRTLWGFDSFAGFPEPTAEDRSPRDAKKGERNNTTVPSVMWLLRDAGIPEAHLRDRVKLVPGFFEKSLSRYDGKGIAFLHIDVDLYQSYVECLRELYPRVARGGVVMFDEYGDPMFPGGKKAVDEYFREQNVFIQKDALSGKHYAIKR